LKKHCEKLRLAQTISDMPSIEDYVAQKSDEHELQKKIKQWETKVQLAQTEMRRARRVAGGGSTTKLIKKTA